MGVAPASIYPRSIKHEKGTPIFINGKLNRKIMEREEVHQQAHVFSYNCWTIFQVAVPQRNPQDKTATKMAVSIWWRNIGCPADANNSSTKIWKSKLANLELSAKILPLAFCHIWRDQNGPQRFHANAYPLIHRSQNRSEGRASPASRRHNRCLRVAARLGYAVEVGTEYIRREYPW